MKHFYLAIFVIVLVFSSNAQSVATFDDLTLAPESYWNGSDASGSFKSGGTSFNNSYNSDYLSWSGFAYSNMSDITTAGYMNQYSAITGKGFHESSNYAVCYPYPTIEVGLTESSVISGFYVTNATYPYLSMKNGDDYAKKFGGETGNDPDYFKLTIEAIDDQNEPIDTIDFYLADFRFSDNSKDYMIDKWIWVDLSELKAAKKLRFSLSSTDNGDFGMNTPGYFCIDDFNGEKPYEYKDVSFSTFEAVNTGTVGYYNGSDDKGYFTDGNFRFMNEYNAEYFSWSGFAASAKTDVATPGYENQYSAITGAGVDGSTKYAVAYPAPKSTILFKDTVLSGMYITNSTYAYLSMKNGDDYAKKFGGETGNDEDFLKLTIEGFNADAESTGKIDFYLADFRSTDNSTDYILDSWKWQNLEELGRISKLEFSMSSTDNGNWGMNTPGYFCIDNLNIKTLTSIPEIQKLQISVFPNPFNNQIVVSGFSGKAQLTLLDISGTIIEEYNNIENGETISDLNKLSSGIYLLKIKQGDNLTTRKLIKN